MLHTALVEAAENNPMWSNEASCTKLANTMLDIYDGVKRSFRPDDYRHYQFTPRNLTEWVQGLQRLAMGVEVLDGFAYEASRIFRDRLVGEEAISTYDGIVRQAMAVQWQWSGPSGGEATLLSTLGASVEERLDSKSPPPALAQWKLEDFAELAAGKLKQFERESKDLGLLLFPEVLQRIAALDRVLSLPGGSVLLCGRAGVGRRSATSLVSYIHHMDMFSPCLTRNYDVKAFRNDLKVRRSLNTYENSNTHTHTSITLPPISHTRTHTHTDILTHSLTRTNQLVTLLRPLTLPSRYFRMS
jgi:dynein heavy chain 2